MHFCNISLHDWNNGSLGECGTINVFMSVHVRHTAALPAAYSFLWIKKNVSTLDQCNQMCLLCFSSILNQEVRTIPVPQDKLNWKAQSYLFKVMYPTVLHKTTHKHLFTVNTTLLIWLLISHIPLGKMFQPITVIFRSSSTIKSGKITTALKHVSNRLRSQSI